MDKIQLITEDHIDLMHHIENYPNASQREIAKKTGLSIGKVNYILKSLIDVGFVKIVNFNKSTKKINYAYNLTPSGIKKKVFITNQFIIKKKEEYDKLKSYIK